MDFTKQWSSLICLSSLICVIAELMLPPGKMEKIMHMTLSVFMICAIISPFSKKSFRIKPNIKFETENLKQNKIVKFTDNVNSQIKDIMINNLKAVVFNSLKDINVIPEKIQIFMDTTKDNCISIIKCKIFISKESQNDKDKIISNLKNNLGIETEVICS